MFKHLPNPSLSLHKPNLNKTKLLPNFSKRLTIIVSILLLATTSLATCLLLHPKPVTAGGQIIYVNQTANGANNGSSWEHAYTNLQSALETAVSNDEIWVATGEYTPTAKLDDANSRTATFQITQTLQLYGGFAGTETLRSQRDWTANPTTLSGDLDGNGLAGSNAYHVLYINGSIAGSIIDGFTITNGNANGSYPHNAGGGMICLSGVATCSPTLANLIFLENHASFGGGLFNSGFGNGSSPQLTQVTFDSNLATVAGGGIYNDGFGSGSVSSPTLTNVVFRNNRAISTSNGAGGGMYNNGNSGTSSPVLENVTFVGNWAGEFGGGLYNSANNGGQSSPTLNNVLFSGNLASNDTDDGRGGGKYTQAVDTGSANPTLINTTFSGNMAYGDGGGMVNNSPNNGTVNPTVVNSIFWGNFAGQSGAEIVNINSAPQISNSLIANSKPSGVWDATLGANGGGNLDENPLFVDPAAAPNPSALAPMIEGNYHLQTFSPAINNGDNQVVTATNDLDGDDRILGNVVDMGAFEWSAKVYLPMVVSP